MEKISVGAWIFGMGTDRYVGNGYKPYLNFLERVDRISKINNVTGIEIGYPNNVDLKNLDEIKAELDKHGLKVACLGIEHVCDAEWKFGSFTAKDKARREKTIQLTKEGMDVAAALGADVINLWLGQDGFDYVFQMDYTLAWKHLIEGLQECAEYRPEIKIGLEYKTSEPKMNCILNNGGKALAAALATGKQNVGITLDVGHAFNARENPAEIASVLMAENRLFHLHLNDNYGWSDDDMPVGTVHWPQTIEYLYWMKKLNYFGWYSLDLYPYRDDATEACNASIEFVMKALEMVNDPAFERELAANQDGAPSKLVKWLIQKALK